MRTIPVCSECGWTGDGWHHGPACPRLRLPPDATLDVPDDPLAVVPSMRTPAGVWYGSADAERDRQADRRRYGDRE